MEFQTNIIYATEARDTEIVHAVVEAPHQKLLPVRIKNRNGDILHISHDSLDGLILALKQIQSQVKTGLIK